MPPLDIPTALTLLSCLLLLLPCAVLLALGGHKRASVRLWVAGGLLVGIGVWLLVQGESVFASAGVVVAYSLLLGGLGLAAFALRAEKRLNALSFWFAAGFLLLLAVVEGGLVTGAVNLLRWVVGWPAAATHVHFIAWPVPLLAALGAAMGNVAFIGLVLGNEHERSKALVLEMAEQQERERMAEVLAHMDRASNLSVISASLGLQLAQPLAAIKLTTQLLKRRAEPSVPAEVLVQELDQVVEQVRRSARVVDQVRQFIKPPALQPGLVDVQALVKDVWDLLRQEAQRQGVQVKFTPEAVAMEAFMDRVRASQVIMNFLRSGAEGMQLGATGPLGVRFRRSGEMVEVVFALPWPASAHSGEDALNAPLVAHAAVFDSRRSAAAETLALFHAGMVVREPSSGTREIVLWFLGAQSSGADKRVETA